MNIWKYTNGTGHLIMSIVATVTGLLMVLISTDATVRGTGVSIVLGINAYWFVSGSAKQVATEVVKQVNVAQGVAITAAVAAVSDTQNLPKLPPGGQP